MNENEIRAKAEKALLTLRKCNGFDPLNKMIPYTFENGMTTWYMPVADRVAWFLNYCSENNLTPLIDESDAKISIESKTVLSVCKIYINGAIASTGICGRFFDINNPENINSVVQTACTIAKGRALSNMGFGATQGSESESGAPFPPEMGVEVKNIGDEPMECPFLDAAAPVNSVPDLPHPPAQPASSPAAPMKTTNMQPVPQTLEEAKAYVVSVGINKGKTLGELCVLSDGMKNIDFYANKYSGRDEGLKIAARLILEA